MVKKTLFIETKCDRIGLDCDEAGRRYGDVASQALSLLSTSVPIPSNHPSCYLAHHFSLQPHDPQQ